MRNEAPVIVLAEWAARVNAETRVFMGHSVELSELLEARGYLDGLMSDQEAAACVAADLERVRDDLYRDPRQSPDDGPRFRAVSLDLRSRWSVEAEAPDILRSLRSIADDDYDGLSPTFAAACRAADEKQRRKPPDPTIERARRLLADDVSLERAWHELNKPAGVAASTLEAAEYLLREGDPERLRQWLNQHGAAERKAIQKHLGGKHAAKPRTDR